MAVTLWSGVAEARGRLLTWLRDRCAGGLGRLSDAKAVLAASSMPAAGSPTLLAPSLR